MRQNMRVGYARTSTLDQQAGFEAQLRELKAAGCEKVFQEQVSSVGKREQLEAALDFVRDGDFLVVSKLDRLARSTQHLLDVVERVKRKGANLQILNLAIDMSTATGTPVIAGGSTKWFIQDGVSFVGVRWVTGCRETQCQAL
jgi:DNA invertase Pin-like site-specific DNA recombinase